MMQMKTKAMKIDDDHYVVSKDISHAVVKNGITHFDVRSIKLTTAEFNAQYSFVTIEVIGGFANVEEKTNG